MRPQNVLLSSYNEVPGSPGAVIRLWFDYKGRHVAGTVTGDNGTDCFFRMRGDVLEYGTSHGWQTLEQMSKRMGAASESEAISWAFYRRVGDGFASSYFDHAFDSHPFWKKLIDDAKHLALSSDVMMT